jgi:hypothetical protein
MSNQDKMLYEVEISRNRFFEAFYFVKWENKKWVIGYLVIWWDGFGIVFGLVLVLVLDGKG